MDSAAGWVLSATEIAKIMLHLSTRKSNGESSQNILYHLGSIAGTESIAFSAPNFALGMLINTRSARENYLTAWMQRVANFLRSDFLR
uniref:Beta-lactamase-related domain-containing protein n=1 Tax=Parascaris equorum TaxID=6256 RepID=A0A914REI7_PAREQ